MKGKALEDYVHVPFVDGGRTFEGADCYGLVRLYLLHMLNVALPAYSETSAADLVGSQDAMLAASKDGETWQQVFRPNLRHGDVALMWGYEPDPVSGKPIRTRRHVGVIIADGRLLHVEAGTDSVIVPLSHAMVRSRLESFWRHRKLR